MFGSRAARASVASSSTVLCTGAAITPMPSDGAAASAALTYSFDCGAVSGLKTSANGGHFRTRREFSASGRLRGGAGRTRTNHQSVMECGTSFELLCAKSPVDANPLVIADQNICKAAGDEVYGAGEGNRTLVC